MYENQITYTLIMVFKDAAGSIRSIKVPNARPNVTGKEVRKVMEQIVRDGVFLSRNGLPLVKLVRAVLVKVWWLFAAAKFTRGPVEVETGKSAAPVESNEADVPTGCPDAISVLQGRGPAGDPCIVQTADSNIPTGCPTTIARLPRATVPRPVGADGNKPLQSSKLLYFVPGCRDLRAWRNPGAYKKAGTGDTSQLLRAA